MYAYAVKEINQADPVPPNTAILVASGDLRLSANQTCWPAQDAMEKKLLAAFEKEGWTIIRGHPYDPAEKHGFISSQRMGMKIFEGIHPDAPVIVAEAVWQYSHHVLAGLRDHRGPILTVANWSGQWPGLVGLLNLNGCLTKMGVDYSTIWSLNFTDAFFVNGIRQWIQEGRIDHEISHVRDVSVNQLPGPERELGQMLAQRMKHEKAILGIFDEGCMGMYNGIIDDEMLNSMGIYKERLSQSALVAEMRLVTDDEAQAARDWLDERGLTFVIGPDEVADLTDRQILEQLKMYIAAVRIADRFGCNAIGIQYQQGLKDMAPASDLAEGLLNNVERPPVYDPDSGSELFPGQAVVHFNEVDEGAGVDALVTNWVWTAMGFDPATTLHDLRWGEHYKGNGIDDFVWVLLISGAAPPSHFVNGYTGAFSERQPAMYFPMGGGSLKGVSKPGHVVWSRVFVMDGKVHADLGRATAVELPEGETQRRWEATTPEWPIMHAVLHGVTRDQMMARHKANHINVVYAPTPEDADKALAAKAAMLAEMGMEVHFCGDVRFS
jgi:hypothetical protein